MLPMNSVLSGGVVAVIVAINYLFKQATVNMIA